jgi:hypothetical protein
VVASKIIIIIMIIIIIGSKRQQARAGMNPNITTQMKRAPM